MTETMLSRSGHSGPQGKLTRRVDVPVSEELDDALTALATLANIPKAEFVRALMETFVYGRLDMARRVARGPYDGQWEQSRTEGRG